MKRCISLLSFLLLSAMAFGQVRTPVHGCNIQKEIKPPILSVEGVSFSDAGGNRIINANEKSYINFVVRNDGRGDGFGCVAKVKMSGASQDVRVSSINIPVIKVGQTKAVSIPVTSGMNTTDGKVQFTIQVDEPNGFGTDPFTLDVETKSFEAPLVKVADYALTGTTTTLERKKPFNLQILLQNVKYGQAEDVSVEVVLPENIFVLGGDRIKGYSKMEAGEKASIDLELIANGNYQASSIPVKVKVREKYGRFSEDRSFDLAFNQTMSSRKISVAGEAEGPRQEIHQASLSSDVDKNIPQGSRTNDNTFVVIVANENYRYDARVAFANNDGRIFRDYCERTLGIPSRNIRVSMDATGGDIRANLNWIKDICEAYKGDANVIFYYAGHGVPDGSGESYILPVDAEGRNPAGAGISTTNLYASLSSCNTRSTLVFMDACFSGAMRDGGMVDKARGVVLNSRVSAPKGNMVVFSAASGNQTAYQYQSQYHGMFTYFLLKKLQETSGNVTLGELGNYIIDQVGRNAVIENGKPQTPTVLASPSLSDSWRSLRL